MADAAEEDKKKEKNEEEGEAAPDGAHKKKRKKKKKKKSKAEREAEEAAQRAAEEAERQRILEEQRQREIAIKKAKAIAQEKAERERQAPENYTPFQLWGDYEYTREAMHEATLSGVPAHSLEMDALRKRLAEERKGLDWLAKGHKHKVKGEPHFVLPSHEDRVKALYADPMPGTHDGPKVPGTLVDDEKCLQLLYRTTGGPHPDSPDRVEPKKIKGKRRKNRGGDGGDGDGSGSVGGGGSKGGGRSIGGGSSVGGGGDDVDDGEDDEVEEEREEGVCYREKCVAFRAACEGEGAKYPAPKLRARWRRRRNWRNVGRWMEFCEAYKPPGHDKVQPPYPKNAQPEAPTIEEIVKAAVPPCEGLVIHKARVINVSLFANSLRGPLPANLSFLTHLKVLNLHGNRLTGPIPEGLAKLSLLTHIDLSRNELTG